MNSEDNLDDKIEKQIKNMLDNVLEDESINVDVFNTLSLSENHTDYSSQEFNRRDKRALSSIDKKKDIIHSNEIEQGINRNDKFFSYKKKSNETQYNSNHLSPFSNVISNRFYQMNNSNINFRDEIQNYNLNANIVVTPCETLNFEKNHYLFNNRSGGYLSPNISFNSSRVNTSGSASPDSVGQSSNNKFNYLNTNKINLNNEQNSNYFQNKSLNMSTSSNHSNENFPIRLSQRMIVVDDKNSFPTNEFDAILEMNVSKIEKLEEDCYSMMKGNFFKILTTQNGSRVLQKSLKNTSQEILSFILHEIQSKLYELMIDSYANYFCQKFFGYLKNDDKILFLQNIQINFCNIANNKIGTYPLQAIIEQLKIEREKEILIEVVKANAIEMFYDSQGVHVIEKIIICFEEDKINFIYDLALENFMKLANNTNGLCIIKKIITHVKFDETLKKILDLISENCFILIQNPYGNYAIQTAVDVWTEENFRQIIKQFFNKFTNLSMQKFSSNVVEKLLQKGGGYVIGKFIEEVSINNRIVDLMKNNYGNYVVQKVLKISSDIHKNKLLEIILRNLDKIGDKKLILKWRYIVQSHINPDDYNGMMLLKSLNNDSNRNFEDGNNLKIPRGNNNLHINKSDNNLSYLNINISKNNNNNYNNYQQRNSNNF